jgi:site-specific DNA recombinase
MPDVRVKGLHRPIVSQELFDRVQDILNGKKPVAVPKRHANPAFPLRGLVHCAACGAPLTASFCRSKTGRKYPYYYCRTRGCRAVKSVHAQNLGDQFVALLSRLRPNPETVSEFPKIAAEVWERAQGDAAKNARKLTAKLEDAKKLKAELLRAKLRGEVSQPDYEQANGEFSREIADLDRQLREVSAVTASADAFIRFVELALVDMAALWQQANDEQRRRVRQVLFSDGILLDSKRKNVEPQQVLAVQCFRKSERRKSHEI